MRFKFIVSIAINIHFNIDVVNTITCTAFACHFKTKPYSIDSLFLLHNLLHTFRLIYIRVLINIVIN